MEHVVRKLDVAESKPDGDDIFNKFRTSDAQKEAISQQGQGQGKLSITKKFPSHLTLVLRWTLLIRSRKNN